MQVSQSIEPQKSNPVEDKECENCNKAKFFASKLPDIDQADVYDEDMIEQSKKLIENLNEMATHYS